MDVEAEIRDLKRRVSELEGSFGFLTEQVKGVHKDLLRFEAKTEERFGGVDQKLREHDGRFDRLESKIDGVDRKVDGLARSLPRVVADTMREVLREQKGKS
jgi:predicted RNase H-like nuclease (RuvC/YqgF family)